jgi:hypothetical protein
VIIVIPCIDDAKGDCDNDREKKTNKHHAEGYAKLRAKDEIAERQKQYVGKHIYQKDRAEQKQGMDDK